MNAKALICDEQQNFALTEVVLNDPAPDQVAIRTHFTGVSIGTEFGLISGKISKMNRNPFPLCTGYQGTGIIEAVGADIDNFAVGDEVYFRGNDAMRLADGTEVGCVSGGHCTHIVTRPNTTHGVAKMVPGAGMDVASLFVMPAVGLYGVDMANPRMGDTVVVHGVGMIGLGVVAACAQRGCVVVAVDIDEKPLSVAKALGADLCNQRQKAGRGRCSTGTRARRCRCGIRVYRTSAVHRSGDCPLSAVWLFRLAGPLRRRSNLLGLSHAARQAATDVFPLRRRLAALPSRCDQEHGDGSAPVGTLHYPSARVRRDASDVRAH